MIFYFSGTGNSAWVAQKLAAHLKEQVYSIGEGIVHPQSYTLSDHERVGFVFPVYAWGPPQVVLQFLKLLQLPDPDYLYFVCTCGDDVGKTGDVFTAAVKQKGWECSAGFSVIMPNTYVSLPGFDIDDADTERIKVTNARSRIAFLAQEIDRKVRQTSFNCHEGAFPRMKTYVIRPFFTRYLMKVSPFHSTDDCISCRKCESVCSLQNIRLVQGRPVWGDTCAHCLACYHVCPKHAVEYGKRTQGKGQYKSEHLV